ncbi:hypothetical protein BD770DRAFT_413969 [Pilaira anomala]|nr:hypothetical protein BD770DRAFT_413969 [Pilaira anomala]
MLNKFRSVQFIVTSNLLLLSTVSAFGFSLFSPGFPINAGGGNMVVFGSDSPKLVTFKIAVQNKDNTLSAIESFSAPNTMTGDFVRISIPDDVEPGINYWFVAVDSTNESNYATLGPLVIRKMFDSKNPTASVTADSSSTPYQTSGGGNVAASPTGSLNYAVPTGSSTTMNRVSPVIKPTGSDLEDDHSLPISVGTIVGIAAGGIAFLMIATIILYCFCFKKAIKTIAPLVNNLTTSNDSENKPASKPSTAVNMSGIHKFSVSPVVTPAKPQKQAAIVTPSSSQSTPSSSVPAPNTADFSFNVNNENTYNHPYSSTMYQQQTYPFYPYYYDNSETQQQQVLPYPAQQDSMPVPEHFKSEEIPLYPPPLSPTLQNYNTQSFQQQQQQQKQQYPVYNHQNSWENQQDVNKLMTHGDPDILIYPSIMPDGKIENQTASKIEQVQFPVPNFESIQRVENGNAQSGKEEYIQKPDDTIIYNNKPHREKAPYYSKPNE